MKHILLFGTLLAFLAGCNATSTKTEGELTQAEKLERDSISKVQQALHADSMKKTNPLLIMPPDSIYTGDYVDKYPNGIVKFKGFFRQGKRHGQWMSFYPNGGMWSEMHYDKGLREGLNTTYFEDGKPRYTGFYKNDLRDSLWIYYDSLGREERRILFKNDRLQEELPVKK